MAKAKTVPNTNAVTHRSEAEVIRLMQAEGLELATASSPGAFVWSTPEGDKYYAIEVIEEEEVPEEEEVAPSAPTTVTATPATKAKNYTAKFLERRRAIVKSEGIWAWKRGGILKDAAAMAKLQEEVGTPRCPEASALVGAVAVAQRSLEALAAALGDMPKSYRGAGSSSDSNTIGVGSRVQLRPKARAGYEGLMLDTAEVLVVETVGANSARLRVRSAHDGVMTLPSKDLVLA